MLLFSRPASAADIEATTSTSDTTSGFSVKNSSGATLLRTRADGKVGIGTASPTSALEVVGTAQLRGATGLTGLYVDSSGNVGIGTTAPGSKLEVAGAIATAVTTKTSNYTVTASDSVLLGDASGGSITFTLPTASGIAGRKYTFKKIDSSANAVVIDGYGSETIDGAATYSLSSQWKYVQIVSDGTGWVIVGNN